MHPPSIYHHSLFRERSFWTTPSLSRKYSNFTWARGLVNTSATCSVVGTYLSFTTPFSHILLLYIYNCIIHLQLASFFFCVSVTASFFSCTSATVSYIHNLHHSYFVNCIILICNCIVHPQFHHLFSCRWLHTILPTSQIQLLWLETFHNIFKMTTSNA